MAVWDYVIFYYNFGWPGPMIQSQLSGSWNSQHFIEMHSAKILLDVCLVVLADFISRYIYEDQ